MLRNERLGEVALLVIKSDMRDELMENPLTVTTAECIAREIFNYELASTKIGATTEEILELFLYLMPDKASQELLNQAIARLAEAKKIPPVQSFNLFAHSAP